MLCMPHVQHEGNNTLHCILIHVAVTNQIKSNGIKVVWECDVYREGNRPRQTMRWVSEMCNLSEREREVYGLREWETLISIFIEGDTLMGWERHRSGQRERWAEWWGKQEPWCERTREKLRWGGKRGSEWRWELVKEECEGGVNVAEGYVLVCVRESICLIQ